jgi:hypothetical protein
MVVQAIRGQAKAAIYALLARFISSVCSRAAAFASVTLGYGRAFLDVHQTAASERRLVALGGFPFHLVCARNAYETLHSMRLSVPESGAMPDDHRLLQGDLLGE